MASIEQRLDPAKFLRIDRSTIVELKSIENRQFTVSNEMSALAEEPTAPVIRAGMIRGSCSRGTTPRKNSERQIKHHRELRSSIASTQKRQKANWTCRSSDRPGKVQPLQFGSAIVVPAIGVDQTLDTGVPMRVRSRPAYLNPRLVKIERHTDDTAAAVIGACGP